MGKIPPHRPRRKSRPAPIARPASPEWAADWITTPPAAADEDDYDEEEEDGAGSVPAGNVLAAFAGGALAGLGLSYLMKRLGSSERGGTAAPRRRGGARPSRRDPSRGAHPAAQAVPAPAPSAGPTWFNDFIRAAEAEVRKYAEAEKRAREASQPATDDDEAEDRAAAELLGVRVDASADEIGKAFRNLVRKKMQTGAFHDQPGADVTEAARLISAKNRLSERAKRREGAS